MAGFKPKGPLVPAEAAIRPKKSTTSKHGLTNAGAYPPSISEVVFAAFLLALLPRRLTEDGAKPKYPYASASRNCFAHVRLNLRQPVVNS
jgi:hypothetical protein